MQSSTLFGIPHDSSHGVSHSAGSMEEPAGVHSGTLAVRHAFEQVGGEPLSYLLVPADAGTSVIGVRLLVKRRQIGVTARSARVSRRFSPPEMSI